MNHCCVGNVPDRWCCVMGNESSGISTNVIDVCNYTIRIDMEPGVDSLSVPIAAGILLNGLRERECKCADR
jgi:tRNA G18 (ribose-2'-O)-methylase SpoU